MESQNLCAYNRTRECFLGLEVSERDVRYAQLRDLVEALTLKSGEGLWVSPFVGIPAINPGVLLDLVYLDSQCRVVDTIESFLSTHEPPSNSQAASLLALPPRTIYSSQTQRGDQLVICLAEEMELRLEKLTLAREEGTMTVQSAALVREVPLWSGGPGVLELENRSKG